MTEDEYRKAVLDVERFVLRHGFSCPIDCYGPDAFEHHMQAALTYFNECIDAAYYEMDPPTIDTGIPHLDENIARIERDWMARKAQ